LDRYIDLPFFPFPMLADIDQSSKSILTVSNSVPMIRTTAALAALLGF